jgi:NADPH:quinone reductase-like Zn-dependent oxidoreductase
MKAIVHTRYGSPDVLRLADLDKPLVDDDAALVRVRAASVNSGDWRVVRGEPFLIRSMGGWRRPKEPRLGSDVAGVVEAVGKDVTDLKPGDEVYGVRTGAFAEYVVGRTFVPKPVNLSFEEAAAVPVAACTALQAIRDHGQLEPGQRVAVTGAGGGVGTFAVQIAKAFGGDVTAVTRTAFLDLARSIGADRVIDYTAEDFTRSGARYDLIVDVAGNQSMGVLQQALTPTGRLVLVGAGKGHVGPLVRMFGGIARARRAGSRIRSFIASVTKEDLLTLKDLIEAGKVAPVIDRTYSLSETAQAIRRIESTDARGKIVITI